MDMLFYYYLFDTSNLYKRWILSIIDSFLRGSHNWTVCCALKVDGLQSLKSLKNDVKTNL